VYAIWGQKLYRWAGIGWTGVMADLNFSRIYSEGGHLFGTGNPAALFDITDPQNPLMYESSELIVEAAYDNENADYWVANNTRGLMHVTAQGTVDYPINSPAVNVPYRMYYGGEKLFVVNGGRWATQYGNAPYIMMYEGGEWTNILPARLQSQATSRKFTDPVSVAVDPADNNHYWVACYGNGLFEMQGDSVLNRYTAANSGLGSATGSVSGAASYTRVDGLLLDEGTLWIGNGSVGIRALRDTSWLSFRIPTVAGSPAPFHTPGQVFKDRLALNRIWFSSCRLSPGIALLDYGSSVDDPEDDRSLYRSEFDIEDLPQKGFGSVRAAAMDYDGNIWLGTGDGLFYMPASTDFFNTDQLPQLKHAGAIDGFSDWLLKDQTVECLAIDSFNRKWIGSETLGVYVINQSNDSVVAHFTTTNSSLPSNSIISLAINPVTQEVMIGTAAGLVSCVFEEDPLPATPDQSENPDTALDETNATTTVKQLQDGRILIIRSGRTYDVLGRPIH